MPDDTPPDSVLLSMHHKCDAALTYIRDVHWGRAEASYLIADNGRQLSIAISISCFSKAPEETKT